MAALLSKIASNLVAGKSAGMAKEGLWDGLNQHLLGQIYKLKKEDTRWVQDTSAPAVVGALQDASMEVAMNWQSPFESSGTESQAPALAAMLQTGALQPLVAALAGSSDQGVAAGLRDKINGQLTAFEGRTGITKLNSTQVFNGMQPIKITATLLLRAWRDPLAEVERPLAQLMDWMLPQELSADGSVIARAANTARNEAAGMVEMLMPSLAPLPVALRYKNRLFRDMVIEVATIPLDSPIDARGNFVQLAMPVTFCTRSAIDRNDWKAIGPI